jgi:hypothetical protein
MNPWNSELHLIKEGEATCAMVIHSDRQPMLGEAIEDANGLRFIVVDVTWDMKLSKVVITAVYQEDEDAAHAT